MFGEKAVRFSAAPISSAIDSNGLRNTSSMTGSTVLRRGRHSCAELIASGPLRVIWPPVMPPSITSSVPVM